MIIQRAILGIHTCLIGCTWRLELISIRTVRRSEISSAVPKRCFEHAPWAPEQVPRTPLGTLLGDWTGARDMSGWALNPIHVWCIVIFFRYFFIGNYMKKPTRSLSFFLVKDYGISPPMKTWLGRPELLKKWQWAWNLNLSKIFIFPFEDIFRNIQVEFPSQILTRLRVSL